METIIKNWGVMRVIRLAVGLYAFYEVIKNPDFLLGAMAAILILMAIFNVGCGAQGCGIPTSTKSSPKSTDEDVSYEEIK